LVSRSDYYRDARVKTTGAWEEERMLREAIEAIVLTQPGYGYRRVTKALAKQGMAINHKRVLRIMREEGWLWQRARRWVKTTDSDHGLTVYPNLLAKCGWRQLTAPNQAWMGDITFIRLGEEWCYLAALLDGFSRRAVGWELSESLEASLALSALEQALGQRLPDPGWIHHSDRGVQYACRGYVERVVAAGGRVSMAAKGTPRENALAERFMRTLKEEAVYLEEYRTVAEARRGIDRFLGEVYNRKRLHSSLGYLPPCEFEELFAAGVLHDTMCVR
jgi:transposase InsO family protein